MNTLSITKPQRKTAWQLLIAATICLVVIFFLHTLTQTAAKRSEEKHLIRSLSMVLPEQTFDNNLLTSRQQTEDAIIYQACQRHQPQYIIYEISTEKGYSGLIKLLVTVDLTTNTVYNARPLFHQETPGLGDQIELEKSPWLTQFFRPLSTPTDQLAIKQDGGQIDALTGATITSRAVSDLLRQQVFKPHHPPKNHCKTKENE